MKKIIICSAIVLASGITAMSFNKKDEKLKEKETIEIKADFMKGTKNIHITDIGTAD